MRVPARLTGITKGKWFGLVWIVSSALVLMLAGVLIAKWLRELPNVQSFIEQFPGESELPANAPVGFPAWLAWQHFLNVFLILLIIRSGWQIRTTPRPPAFWTRNNKGLIRTKNPPRKISLILWFHLSLDALWVLNGIVFYILIFSTGQWMRLVPLNWDVIPNAVSVGIQYLSLAWPTENGWVNYNSLQLLSYFITVFIAAPLAIISGVRMSSAWPERYKRLSAAFTIQLARAIHFPVMLFFVAFIVIHVTLVLATGALRNLNHMYAGRDDERWIGLWIFAASLVVLIAAWIAAKPLILRSLASLTGSVTR